MLPNCQKLIMSVPSQLRECSWMTRFRAYLIWIALVVTNVEAKKSKGHYHLHLVVKYPLSSPIPAARQGRCSYIWPYYYYTRSKLSHLTLSSYLVSHAFFQ